MTTSEDDRLAVERLGEALSSADVSRQLGIDGQIRDLEVIADMFHEMARTKNSIGIRMYHNAHCLASQVDRAVGTLNTVKRLTASLALLQES